MKRAAKKPVTPRVERTRNYKTETQSQHIGKLRSALRNISRWWKPFSVALKAASVKCSVGGRIFCERLFVEDINKLEVLCKDCHKEETAKQREERKLIQ